MIRWISSKRASPIGVDLGSTSVKLVQFDTDHSRLLEAVRWDLAGEGDPKDSKETVSRRAEALRQALQSRSFRGHDAVICLGADQLFIQNIRLPRTQFEDQRDQVIEEAARRIPYPVKEAEVRYIEVGDVRQGENTMREFIVMACHQDVVQEQLEVFRRVDLRPIAIEAEPSALLRCYLRQFRRDEDQNQRMMFVHVGWSRTGVIIAEGSKVLFLKYLDLGGKHMDEALANNLQLGFSEAAALRRHNGDRRKDQQDPEVVRSIRDSVRPVVVRLATELSRCLRYYSVTFRGRPLSGVIVSGGEADDELTELLSHQLDMTCTLGDPLRSFDTKSASGRRVQWDIATGLALRPST